MVLKKALELGPLLAGLNWIIVSQLLPGIPTEPAAPDKYSLSLFMLQATPPIWLRTKAANLCTALLSHEHLWPCELPGGRVPFGPALRRFCFAAGKVFRFVGFITYEFGVTSPGGLVRDVLFRVAPWAFGLQNTTHLNIFRFAGYSNLSGLRRNCHSAYCPFMGSALDCGLRLSSLAGSNETFVVIPLYPAG